MLKKVIADVIPRHPNFARELLPITRSGREFLESRGINIFRIKMDPYIDYEDPELFGVTVMFAVSDDDLTDETETAMQAYLNAQYGSVMNCVVACFE